VKRFAERILVAGLAFASARTAIAAPAPDAGADATSPRLEKLADGVWAWIRRDPPGLMVDANSLVIVNDDDVVIVDAPEASRDLLAEVRKRTAKPVRYVVHTHWHDDHIAGDHVWREAYPGVELVGQSTMREYLPTTGAANRRQMVEGAPKFVGSIKELVSQGKSPAGGELTPEERRGYESDFTLVDRYMQEVPNAPLLLPTLTIDDSLVLHRGERRIEIRHLGRGHTSADLVVWLPNERIAAVGDLVGFPIPLVGGDQSHVADWGATLGRLRALRPAMIVPGHGPVLDDDTQPARMERLFDSIQAQVAAAVGKGRNLDETRKEVDLAAFRREFTGESKHLGFIFAMYVTRPAVESAFRDLAGAK